MKFFSLLFIILICVSCSPPDFNDGIRHAEELTGIGEYDNAISVYKKLIKHKKSDAEAAVAYIRMGDLYANSKGNLIDAIDAYQKAVESQPFSLAARVAHEKRAQIFGKQGLALKVVEEYSALLKYFPKPEYRLDLGEAYIASKEYVQARTELRDFVENVDVPPEQRQRALFDIGETYFLESDSEKAIRFYHALIKESPKSLFVPEAEQRLIVCLEEMGYIGIAHKFAEEVKKNYPNKAVIDKHLEAIEKRSGKNSPKKSQVK